MKETVRIAMRELPDTLHAVFKEQLEVLSALEEVTVDPDIVIAGDAYSVAEVCPVIRVASEKQRLSSIFSQLHQALVNPVGFIKKIMLGEGVVFQPEEKLLVASAGESTVLTDREVEILFYLAKHKGSSIARDALLKNVWNYQEGVDTHTLETHIYRLRQKIERDLKVSGMITTTEHGYSLMLGGK